MAEIHLIPREEKTLPPKVIEVVENFAKEKGFSLKGLEIKEETKEERPPAEGVIWPGSDEAEETKPLERNPILQKLAEKVGKRPEELTDKELEDLFTMDNIVEAVEKLKMKIRWKVKEKPVKPL